MTKRGYCSSFQQIEQSTSDLPINKLERNTNIKKSLRSTFWIGQTHLPNSLLPADTFKICFLLLIWYYDWVYLRLQKWLKMRVAIYLTILYSIMNWALIHVRVYFLQAGIQHRGDYGAGSEVPANPAASDQAG